jgi:hypothetical protein
VLVDLVEMKVLKIIIKIGITTVLALTAFYLPMVLMVYAAKHILGLKQLNDAQFVFTILLMAIVSFIFCWRLDNKFKIYNRTSSMVDKIIKDKKQ